MIAIVRAPGTTARRILPLGTLMIPRASVISAAVSRRALSRLGRIHLGATPATDPSAWAALAATLDPTSAFGQEVSGCAANPTAACYAAAPLWFAAPVNVVGQPAHGALSAPSAPLPTLNIAVSSGNLQSPAVGDRWTISIAGSPAWAGSPVTVYGSTGPSTGVRAESAEGTIDGNGNFSVSGTFTAGQVGAWYEDWKVAGQVIGNWTFTVAPAAAGPSAGPTSSAPAPVAAGVPPVISEAPVTGGVGSFLSAPIGPLPLWGWLGLGLGGYWLFARGR